VELSIKAYCHQLNDQIYSPNCYRCTTHFIAMHLHQLKHRHAVHAEPVTFLFFTVSQMCTTSYACMQVSRNLADDNTPQLCLPKAFLTFWGTRDFIIAVSSQCSRIQMYSHADNALRAWLHVPLRSCPSFKQSSYSFYFTMVFICQ